MWQELPLPDHALYLWPQGWPVHLLQEIFQPLASVGRLARPPLSSPTQQHASTCADSALALLSVILVATGDASDRGKKTDSLISILDRDRARLLPEMLPLF